MGSIPGESVARTVRYARATGSSRFAALIPTGSYGERVSKALIDALRAAGGTAIGIEGYDRSSGSLAHAVQRLRIHGAYDTLLIADNGRYAAQAAAFALSAPVPFAIAVNCSSALVSVTFSCAS